MANYSGDTLTNHRLMINNGTLAGNGTVTNFGTLRASGSQAVALTDVGTLKPEIPVSVYTTKNDYIKTDGAIVIELGGTGTGAYDQLDVAGTANLVGTFDLVPLIPYTDVATVAPPMVL